MRQLYERISNSRYAKGYVSRFKNKASLILLAVLVVVAPVSAQTTGTITGTVQDPNGAVIPDAKITLKNETSGDVRQSVSNGSGYFSIPNVIPGLYDLSVEAPGFKAFQLDGIQVNPGDERGIRDIVLPVGNAANETITVQADVEAPVTSGERSALLNSKQIENLSLQGRDATELIRILPGVAVFAGGGVNNQAGYDPGNVGIGTSVLGNGYNVNGNVNRGGMDLLMDGAHIVDSGCNCGSTQTVDADMVAEVKVQTSNFGADSAKGPVVINVVGKTGTAETHGQAYLYTRQTGWNANDAFNNDEGVPRGDDNKYYPGGNIGGPVPHTNHKLLYFAGFEYYHQDLNTQTLTSWVPTLSMRNGNFSSTAPDNAALCANPNGANSMCNLGSSLNGFLLNGSKIPSSGVIPSSSFDPGGLALFKAYPLPNTDPRTQSQGFNFVDPLNTNQNGLMGHARVDYNITDNSKIYATYNEQRQTDDIPVRIFFSQPFAVPFPGGMSSGDVSHTVTGHFLHTFNASLTNDVGMSLAYVNFPDAPNNPSLVAKTTLGYPYHGVFNNGDPQIPGLSNGFFLHQASADEFDLFQGAGNNGTFLLKKTAPVFQDDLTWVVQRHTLKFGAYIERTINDQSDYTAPNGEVAFDNFGPYTNSSGAGFGSNNAMVNQLLGAVGFVGYDQVNFESVDDMSYRTIAFYAADSWKVLRRLTLDLGVRFENYTPWRDDNGKTGLAVWFPDQFQTALNAGSGHPGLTWQALDPSIPNGGSPSKTLLVSPRFGLAWDAFGTGKTIVRGGWGAYHFHDSFNDFAGPLSTASGSRSFSTGVPTTLAALQTAAVQNLATGAFAVNPSDNQQPVTYTYNLTISQMLPYKSLLEVAYVGNHSNHLNLEGNLEDVNAIPLGGLFAPDPVTGAAANPQNSNAGDYRPFGFSCAVPTRPCPAASLLQGFGNNALDVTNHAGWANYNALQTSWTKQTGHVTFNLNYTFSKALGVCGTSQLNCALADPTNINHDYGPLTIDRTHIFNASYQFELGNRLHDANRVLEGVVNGWTVAGITTWQSGPDLAAFSSNFNLGTTLGSTAPGFFSNRTILGTPDILLQPTLLCNPTSNLGPHQYINGACFGVPSVGQNGSYSLPYIHGPAYFNSDLSLYKTFKITERQHLQFRASGFNFLNHPLTSFNPNAGNLNLQFLPDASGKLVQSNSEFGVADTKFGHRIVELALKYSF
jgi:hypothetical protein